MQLAIFSSFLFFWKMFDWKTKFLVMLLIHSTHFHSGLFLFQLYPPLPSPAFLDHPPTAHHHPQACQLFAWAVNLNFLVQIHFSCLGILTKQFLSTDLVPCANVSTDQAHNAMFWMKQQPHIKIQTHMYLPFPTCLYIYIKLSSEISTNLMLQKTK